MTTPHDPRGRADAWGHDRAVDQVVFRWDTENLSGTTGFGPVACSCPPERADDLFRRTGALLRGTGEVTAPALLRLERADEVLLVRRAPWRDAGGRASTLCHALLGPAAVLDPATCLGLHHWSWQGTDLPLADVRGRLPRVAEAPLVAAADEGLRALTAALPRVRHELTGAVAEFLRHPTASFTLLDPRGDAACPVLWGLHGIFGGQAVRGWTFATHDTDETDRLRFVFVSRWSGAAAAAGNRRRTDPAERCGDRAETVAEALVRHQLRAEYAVGEALQRVASRARGMPLLAQAEAALPLLRAAPQTPSPEPVRTVPPEWPGDRSPLGRLPDAAQGGGPRRGPERGDVRAALDDPHAPSAAEALSRASDDELLRALRLGARHDGLALVVREAAARWPGWGREQRAALCAVVLRMELFVTERAGPGPHPDDAVRAVNAAALYQWAVRPLLGDPDLAAEVTLLLPRLFTSPHGAARAAVRHITDAPSPGLPETAWQALLKAARSRRPDPPARPAGPGAPAGRPGPHGTAGAAPWDGPPSGRAAAPGVPPRHGAGRQLRPGTGPGGGRPPDAAARGPAGDVDPGADVPHGEGRWSTCPADPPGNAHPAAPLPGACVSAPGAGPAPAGPSSGTGSVPAGPSAGTGPPREAQGGPAHGPVQDAGRAAAAEAQAPASEPHGGDGCVTQAALPAAEEAPAAAGQRAAAGVPGGPGVPVAAGRPRAGVPVRAARAAAPGGTAQADRAERQCRAPQSAREACAAGAWGVPQSADAYHVCAAVQRRSLRRSRDAVQKAPPATRAPPSATAGTATATGTPAANGVAAWPPLPARMVRAGAAPWQVPPSTLSR
ncbi:hypothetical protein BJP39_12150 [Streptomyces sp. CC77]|nr:hypothetical protein BJP39_12150 [Streptomyces sp. CC77]